MALRQSQICNITPNQLTILLNDPSRKVRLIDCRSFLEYNDNHIVGAVNICCSKLIKRRLQQEKISLKDLLVHCRIEIDETSDVIVYDQKSNTADDVMFDSFIHVLLKKLVLVFDKVYLLSGGLVNFHRLYPNLCENKIWKYPGLSTFSQPCLPAASSGPTRILSFLYLGSEDDANNKELLQSHNITYELNVSNKCPKPDFLCDGHFMRIPVNDSHNEKLMPHFSDAFQFIDKVRESNESVLVHCLAGISRSPTVAIAYIMKHLMLNCEEAYRYVKSKRATISPNFNFLGQLLEYEKQLMTEGILEMKPVAAFSCPSSQSPETVHAPDLPMFSPPPGSIRMGGKRLNLSLRLSPLSASSGVTSPKDASPTTAMARLQFDKPQGKENRTANSSQPSTSSASVGVSSMNIGFSLCRPTRLVKEQNVSSIQEEECGGWNSMTKSVTKQSLSLSISKEFRSRKCTEQYQQSSLSNKMEEAASDRDSDCYLNTKKCRVHKIIVDEECEADTSASDLPVKYERGISQSSIVSPSNMPDCVHSDVLPSPLGTKRDYTRSDSVSTSGLGSEISDHELLASGSWDMSESGVNPDDGVFSDTLSLYSKSPKPSSRQLQLWSSDSGHWSSTDDGITSPCTWAPIAEACSSSSGETKSPEKRKFSDNLAGSSFQSISGFEKRRSYAEAVSDDLFRGESSRPKRWSLAENKTAEASNESDCSVTSGEYYKSRDTGLGFDKQLMKESKRESEPRTCSSTCSGNTNLGDGSYLHFGRHWFNILSGSDLTCCERQGLYRVHSCPGIIGYQDWLQFRNNELPDSESPPEPVSDSVLLKMRCSHNRSLHQNSFEPEHLTSRYGSGKSRFSSGHIDYDELWSKLRNVQDTNKTDSSSHSSSSTLASSSFSIVVQ